MSKWRKECDLDGDVKLKKTGCEECHYTGFIDGVLLGGHVCFCQIVEPSEFCSNCKNGTKTGNGVQCVIYGEKDHDDWCETFEVCK